MEQANAGAKSPAASYVSMAQFAHLTPATILIVENEAIVRLELADWFAEIGLVVLAARNADEAIGLLDTHPEIQLMMTDIKMPGSMDGLRLAHHVRGRWPPVQIIVASGLINTRLAELPDNSIFVPKPIEPQKLWQILADITGDSRPNPSTRGAASRH